MAYIHLGIDNYMNNEAAKVLDNDDGRSYGVRGNERPPIELTR